MSFHFCVCLSLMETKWPPSWRLHAGGSYLTLIHSPQWYQKDVPNSLLILQVWAEMPRAQERFSSSYRLGWMPRSDVFLVSCLSSLWSLPLLKLLKDEVKPKYNMWLLLLTSATLPCAHNSSPSWQLIKPPSPSQCTARSQLSGPLLTTGTGISWGLLWIKHGTRCF